MRLRRCSRRRGANPPPPNSGTHATLTGAEPPDWRGARGRFFWGPARVRSDLNFSRPLWPAAAGKSARTKGSVSTPRRRRPHDPQGAATPAPQSTGPGGPPPSLGLWGTAAAPAAAKANAAAAGAATASTARPGARRGLMLSSASSPPLWAPRAAEILHIRPPSPSGSRPATRGLRPHPFSSREGARRRLPRGLGCGAGGSHARAAGGASFRGSLIAAASPPHSRGRPRARARRRPRHAWDLLRRGLRDRSRRVLRGVRRMRLRAPRSGCGRDPTPARARGGDPPPRPWAGLEF